MIASDGDGNRVTLSYDYDQPSGKVYHPAAIALCQKMNWFGELIEGEQKPGVHVFTFADSEHIKIVPSGFVADEAWSQ